MTSSPNFTDPQFIDAAGTGGLNAAFGSVSGAIAALASGSFAYGGLLCPESMTVTPAGLALNVGLPAPWGLLASGGVYSAHGTQTGLDTQTYSVNFAGFVPGTGSTTVWLVAQPTTIQQNPVPIPGPPPGHPSYNPNYQPTIGYTNIVNTVSLAVSGAAPNNTTAFALLATTLTAGQANITAWSTSGQVRAGEYRAAAPLMLAAGAAITPQQLQYVVEPAGSGQTNTLPLSALSAGLTCRAVYPFSAGALTIAASGTDSIVGVSGVVSGASLVVPPYGAVELWTDGGGVWQLIAGSPNVTPQQPQQWTAGNVSAVSGLTIAGTTLVSPWLAGTVSAVSGLTISGTTLVSPWLAGTVSAVSGAVVSGGVLIAANINGSATQPFSVSGATTSGQAVNLAQLNGLFGTYNNAASGRAFGTVWTNTTGRPMWVSAGGSANGSNTNLNGTINGVEVQQYQVSTASIVTSISMVVPAGATYQIYYTGASVNLQFWAEVY